MEKIFSPSFMLLSFPDFYAKNIDVRTKPEVIAIHIVGTKFSTVAVAANLIIRIIPIRTIGNHRNNFVLLPSGLYGKWRWLIHNLFWTIGLVFDRIFRQTEWETAHLVELEFECQQAVALRIETDGDSWCAIGIGDAKIRQDVLFQFSIVIYLNDGSYQILVFPDCSTSWCSHRLLPWPYWFLVPNSSARRGQKGRLRMISYCLGKCFFLLLIACILRLSSYRIYSR